MQLLEHPRLITEQEDVHLIETFLISSKPNDALWRVSKDSNINDWIGKDFVIIPEQIFNQTARQPGHVEDMTDGSYEQMMQEIKRHSHGKITKIKGPYNYEDGTDDVFYNAVVKLNNSKSAAVLRENGEKTWVPFSVSPTIWPLEGTDDNITKYKPMGLFLVIKGAYGDNAVVQKMCSGSALKCGTSLSAAIQQLNHDTDDAFLAEVLTSYVSQANNNKIDMSQTQVIDKPEVKEVQEFKTPIQVDLKPSEKITFTKEEYDALNKKITDQEKIATELADIKRERDESNLNYVFGSIEDENIRKEIFERYNNSNTKLVKQVYEDINKHILPKKIEAELKKSNNDKSESKSASTLKPEPKISKDESKSASVEVSDDLSISECRSILRL